MTVDRIPLFVAALLTIALMVGLLFLSGCGAHQLDVPAPAPNHYWVFIDESASVSEQQKVRWPEEAKRLARRLDYGDAVDIYPIHARTADAAYLYHDAIPVFPEEGTRSEKEVAKRKLLQVRRELQLAVGAAIHPAENGPPVRATDVFGAFDRFRPDPGRAGVILILSDALDSADGRLNMEKTCLASLDKSATITSLAERRNWHNGTLAGAGVFFLLPAVATDDAKHCNDTDQLRGFYGPLIGALGGELEDFNTVWD